MQTWIKEAQDREFHPDDPRQELVDYDNDPRYSPCRKCGFPVLFSENKCPKCKTKHKKREEMEESNAPDSYGRMGLSYERRLREFYNDVLGMPDTRNRDEILDLNNRIFGSSRLRNRTANETAMTCSVCGGHVEWQGPLSDLTHTKCLSCGAINSQEPDAPEEEQVREAQFSASFFRPNEESTIIRDIKAVVLRALNDQPIYTRRFQGHRYADDFIEEIQVNPSGGGGTEEAVLNVNIVFKNIENISKLADKLKQAFNMKTPEIYKNIKKIIGPNTEVLVTCETSSILTELAWQAGSPKIVE